jgi:regulatory protein
MKAKNNFSVQELRQIIENWCETREVCISEAKTKLRRWNISETDSDKIISSLIESGTINEERYAKAFANDKLLIDKWGPQKVRQTLKQRGIKESFITKAITEKNINQETIISELLSKKLKSFKKLDSYDIYAKLMRFGISRGFDYSLVSKYAKELSGNQEEE